MKEYLRSWALEHTDEIREKRRVWREAHRGEIRVYAKQWQRVKGKTHESHVVARSLARRTPIRKPEHCEHCAAVSKRLEKHHADYSRPLDVTWLCKPCHVIADTRKRQERRIVDNALIAAKEDLAHESASWASRARDLVVKDAESCVKASNLLRSVKMLRSQVASFWAPHIESACETKRKAEAARKALVDERDKMEAPLVQAETILKRSLLAYEQAQEAARMAEEQRLQAEAQAQAEAATLAYAARLEAEANATGDQGMLQEAQDILAQPIEAPVVSVSSQVPKVQGVSYRDNWKAHPDIDVKALAAAVGSGEAPESFLEPNLTKINQFAKAWEGTKPVPGVRFFNDRTVAARG